jgi:hypothetical protein
MATFPIIDPKGSPCPSFTNPSFNVFEADMLAIFLEPIGLTWKAKICRIFKKIGHFILEATNLIPFFSSWHVIFPRQMMVDGEGFGPHF